MGSVEDLVILDANTSKAVDIEEAAPVDLIARATPPGETVMLPLQQAMKTRPARLCRRIISIGIRRGDLRMILGSDWERRVIVADDRFTALLRQADRA